jgi:hypothetical protein
MGIRIFGMKVPNWFTFTNPVFAEVGEAFSTKSYYVKTPETPLALAGRAQRGSKCCLFRASALLSTLGKIQPRQPQINCIFRGLKPGAMSKAQGYTFAVVGASGRDDTIKFFAGRL